MNGIFLDRDGVIIRKAPEGEYVSKLDEMEFLPGSVEAIADLSNSGFKVIVITNQRGLATGKIRLADLEAIHRRLRQTVECTGGEICDILYCPHDISENCPCRKPKAGMLFRAAKEHELFLPQSWMVGDAASDITAGKTAGCKTVLISPTTEAPRIIDQPDFCTESLSSAAKFIIGSAAQQIATNM
jgi:D-glycero-D-manno-heptose 1,7-bisphosphate phosphatase